MGSTTATVTTERWVIGTDKKPKFNIVDKTAQTNIALSVFSGYGIILYDPNGNEAGRFGTGLTGFSIDEISSVDSYTFEVALDKSLNMIEGYWRYHVCARWTDADFDDSDYETMNDDREILYYSVEA